MAMSRVTWGTVEINATSFNVNGVELHFNEKVILSPSDTYTAQTDNTALYLSGNSKRSFNISGYCLQSDISILSGIIEDYKKGTSRTLSHTSLIENATCKITSVDTVIRKVGYTATWFNIKFEEV